MSKDKPNHNYTHSGKGLTQLYNSKVVSVQQMERPFSSSSSGSGSGWGPFHHEGVVATTADGNRYLVHKGDNYGKSGGNTVVVDVSKGGMSSNWRPKSDQQSVSNGSTISDLVKSGGKDYNLWSGDHCQKAAQDMMKKSGK